MDLSTHTHTHTHTSNFIYFCSSSINPRRHSGAGVAGGASPKCSLSIVSRSWATVFMPLNNKAVGTHTGSHDPIATSITRKESVASWYAARGEQWPAKGDVV